MADTDQQSRLRDYYTRTADVYDQLHTQTPDEHHRAIEFITQFAPLWGLGSILDLGCGTGRGVLGFQSRLEQVRVVGVEPVFALLQQGVAKHGLNRADIACADGLRLPLADASVDAACCFGVLHHVPDPSLVVREMLRVSRRAVFISDANRFGQGSAANRWLKLLVYKAGLWPAFNFLKTRGRGWSESDSDGIAYSYSVYDSLPAVARWADQTCLLPTSLDRAERWAQPLLSHSHVLLAAVRSGARRR